MQKKIEVRPFTSYLQNGAGLLYQPWWVRVEARRKKKASV